MRTTKKRQLWLIGWDIKGKYVNLMSSYIGQVCDKYIDRFRQRGQQVTVQQVYALLNVMALDVARRNVQRFARNITGVQVRKTRLPHDQGNRDRARACADIGYDWYSACV